MDHLPDDVLLMAMQYLDVPDLLACRIVCKRLGDLALHPDVWRRRRLSHTDPWVCPALRLAPCLGEVHLKLPAAGRHSLYTATRCAVAALRLTALVVRGQEALGRLKRLHLDLGFYGRLDPSVSVLLATVASSAGLQTLVVPVAPHCAAFIASLHVSTASAHASSLQHFRCGLGRHLEPFINCMLTVHTSTLRVVELVNPDFIAPRSAATAPLLAGVTNLCKLECGLVPGLQAALACGSLSEVTLWVRGEMPDYVADAKMFLRGAHQLRALQYRDVVNAPANVGLSLVLALTGQPDRSQLASLVVDNDGDFEDSQLEPLYEALPSLPALRHIEMNGEVYVRGHAKPHYPREGAVPADSQAAASHGAAP
ncbi:uncharacterized protein LOC127749373 [Frankliniella occidentalis]|uniref:Uncharacterized protein LOC127749373 n=1 Tax=Frankliniella occidentalis TaxID=133901 RepID=A0A9C6WXS9_FRAOC|nr:uncharacterized protein LOC127749373 [Frankliniella occidentalis]